MTARPANLTGSYLEAPLKTRYHRQAANSLEKRSRRAHLSCGCSFPLAGLAVYSATGMRLGCRRHRARCIILIWLSTLCGYPSPWAPGSSQVSKLILSTQTQKSPPTPALARRMSSFSFCICLSRKSTTNKCRLNSRRTKEAAVD